LGSRAIHAGHAPPAALMDDPDARRRKPDMVDFFKTAASHTQLARLGAACTECRLAAISPNFDQVP
jgi:hypothetical protein